MMNPVIVDVAVEDLLSEVVAIRLLAATPRHLKPGRTMRRGGYGYLRKTISGWNRAAAGQPVFVLTDLDQHHCPSGLRNDWLPDPIHPNLLFRVAVREVEAWLLGDWSGVTRFLQLPKKYVATVPPPRPEVLPDPKRFLVDLARRSSNRDIRLQLAPKQGSTAIVGPEYNACLSEFVRDHWDLTRARTACTSLDKAMRRLSEFKPA